MLVDGKDPMLIFLNKSRNEALNTFYRYERLSWQSYARFIPTDTFSKFDKQLVA